MRADAEATVRGTGPVFQVVPAFESWTCPIGNLVVHIAGVGQALCGLGVEGCENVIRWDFRRTLPPSASLFQVQHVNGHMFGQESVDTIQIGPPHFGPLMWESGDQINADIVESVLTQSIDIAKYIGRSMKPACMLQVVIVKRLHAEADAIYAGTEISLQFRVAKCTGIDFDTDLESTLRQCGDNLLNKLSINDRRRAASEKDRLRLLA